MKTKHKDNKFG